MTTLVCVLSHTQFNYEKEKREREPLKRISEKEGNPAKYLTEGPAVCLPFFGGRTSRQGKTHSISTFLLFFFFFFKETKLDTLERRVCFPLRTYRSFSFAGRLATDGHGRTSLPTINVHVIALPVSVDSYSTTRLKTNISARFLCVLLCFVSTIHDSSSSSSSSHKRQWRRKERLNFIRWPAYSFFLLNVKYHRSTGEVETLTHLVFGVEGKYFTPFDIAV